MDSHVVRLSEAAITDLTELRRWIACEADADTAEAYIARLTAKLMTLRQFPERGMLRPDVEHGFRSIPFERRRIIFYRIVEREVWVERVIDARRDLSALT